MRKCPEYRTGLSRQHRRHGSEARREIQVRHLPVLFGEGREVFPAQAGVDRQIGTQSVVVGGEGAQRRLAQIAAVVVVQISYRGCLIRKAQQEIGQIVTGLQTGEVERAAGVGIGQRVVLPPLETKPIRDGLLAMNLDQRIVDRRRLSPRQRRRCIGQRCRSCVKEIVGGP